MTDLRTALSALLDHYVALVESGDAGHWNPEDEHVVKQARAALSAQQELRSKCWACDDKGVVTTSSNGSGLIEEQCMACRDIPTAQPLTDEQIDVLCKGIEVTAAQNRGRLALLLARAIERAHGIGGTHE